MKHLNRDNFIFKQRCLIMEKYERPYTIEEIKEKCPDKVEILLKDPIHLWRATTGIELIHKEPTYTEQKGSGKIGI